MKFSGIKLKISAAIVAAVSVFSFVATVDAQETVKTVILARHNLRAPLGDKELNELTPHKWYQWTVKAGYLSPKGALAETIMGRYFHDELLEEGLFPNENYVPKAGEVRFYANSFERTIATARYFAAGFCPMADIAIEHHAGINESDPVFADVKINPTAKAQREIDREVASFDGGKKIGERFSREAEVAAKVLDFKDSEFARKNKVKTFATDDTTVANKGLLSVRGMIHKAKRASDAMMLQYYETGGSKAASFGHKMSAKDWEDIAALQYIGVNLHFETPAVSREYARPLLREMKGELTAAERKFAFLCGHDTNIATVLSALQVEDYRLPNSIETKTPLGVMLVIKKIKGDDGKDYADVNLVYQSTQQLTKLELLNKENPPMVFSPNFKGIKRNDQGLYNYDEVIKLIDDAAKV